MSKKAFDQISEGLDEALEYARQGVSMKIMIEATARALFLADEVGKEDVWDRSKGPWRMTYYNRARDIVSKSETARH